MKTYDEFPEFVDGLIYLKVIDGKVNAYGDLLSLNNAEAKFKCGKLFDYVVDPDEWSAVGCAAYLSEGHLALGMPQEELFKRNAEMIRNERKIRLRKCDKVSPMRWNAMTDEQRQAWTDYRIALLDIPQQDGFPWDGDVDKVPWPRKPE